MSISQLVLGTARFGLDGYGFLAGVPKIAPEECERIVRAAWDYGVRWIETAEAYGDAEARLGEVGAGKFRLVTKLAPNLWPDEPPHASSDVAFWNAVQEATFEHYFASARRLHAQLDGYLLHSARYALRPDVLAAFLAACAALRVPLAGVACYTPEEAFAALAAGCTAISVPHNLFDFWAWHAGVFLEAERRGATVFARQPFCQGLLARPLDQVSEELRHGRLAGVAEYDTPALRAMRIEMGLSVALMTAEHVVFGCDDAAQLEADVRIAAHPSAFPFRSDQWRGVSAPLCNPSRFAQP